MLRNIYMEGRIIWEETDWAPAVKQITGEKKNVKAY